MKRKFKNVLLTLFLLSLGTALFAQTKSVTGTITDEQGEALPGATVQVKGTTIGIISNIDGVYTITDVSESTILVYSFTGKLSQEFAVANQTSIDVQLQPDFLGMEEVVVIGYGTQKKSDLISSVATVKAEELTRNTTLDVGEMLRGKATGVQVTTEDAGPGGSSKIQIRGKGSLLAETEPIIIADGVQIGAINDINPNDISSVEILKDAAAQAIYGARASNGVILITTKRGKKGVTSVNYNGYMGFQTVSRNFDVYSPTEYANLKREAFRTTNGGEYGEDYNVFSSVELNSLENEKYIDWTDEVLRKGQIQNHDISISSGTEKTSFYLSGTIKKHTGVVPNTSFKKQMIRLNLDHQVKDWLSVGINTNLSQSKSDDPDVAGILNEVVRSSPLGTVYNEDGSINVHPTGLQENWNPLNDLNEVTNQKKDKNNLVSLFLNLTPVEGLSFITRGSLRTWDRRNEIYKTINSNSGTSSGSGSGELNTESVTETTWDNILSYQKSYGEHSFEITYVNSFNEKKYNKTYVSFPKTANDVLGVYGANTSSSLFINQEGSYTKRLNSHALRFQYNYASKYFVNFSGRRDGSSVFGKENPIGYFPAAALGWNIHKETFMSNISLLSLLKLRASYGSVGNEAIEPGSTVNNADSYPYMDENGTLSGYIPGSRLPNPAIKWETSTTINTAVDFGLFNNRLSGTVEFYKTTTTDLLVERDVPSSTGYETTFDNIGEIENKGVELELNGVVVSTKDLQIGIGITYSANRNKINKLFGDGNEDGIEDDFPANNWFIGYPMDLDYDYRAIGIWQEDEVDDIPNSAQPTAKPGDIKLYSEGDSLVKFKTPQFPDWFGSLNFYVKYKGFDLSVDINTLQGLTKYNPYLAEYKYGGDLRGIFNGVKVDYWTPENTSGSFPRPTNASSPAYLGTVAKQDASFIKISNLTFGYSLPTKILDKAKVKSLRLYFAAQNLYTITEYYSYNPEQNPDDYPDAKTLSIGLQLGF